MLNLPKVMETLSLRYDLYKHAAPYLFRGIRVDENGVNAFGFGQQLCLRVDGLVFFAGQPELDVLLAELCPEELREGLYPV